MKIFYLAHIRMPTDKAHGIQIMKTCEALSVQGVHVELIVPTRKNNIKDDPFTYYNVEKDFVVKKLYCPDLVRFGRFGVFAQYVYFSMACLFYSLSGKADVFYSRDELPIWLLSFFNKKVFWEIHIGKWNFLVSSLAKRCLGIIAISNGIRNFLKDRGADGEKIIVSPDAVELKKFSLDINKNMARDLVKLPKDKKIVMYMGHLYTWKGADTIGRTLKNFDGEYLFVFVGGTEKQVDDFKGKYGSGGNMLMVGQKPHGEIPLYLKSADVLVIPNSGKEDISRLYTSPMKLFEYMASGVPIIASDLPSIREILNDDSAFFFEPDNEKSLTDAIIKVFKDKESGERVSGQDLIDSQKYSWENRAKGIIEFLNKK